MKLPKAVKHEYAAVIRSLADDVLAYVADEVQRERKRRRLQVRERRAAKRAAEKAITV
jgi:hypothetical protein